MATAATSSGALVLARVDGELRLALARETDGEPWVLPKGHVEDGESPLDAARREVAEETGLDNLDVLAYLGMIERPSIEKTGEEVLKTIHVFLAFVRDPPRELVPTDPDVGAAAWLSPAEAVASIPFAEDSEFVRRHLAPLI
jgi:8-oxo-dGTP pyrophosphatase MutT (NUDIX family)